MLKSLRVESRDADPLVICGLTLFQGRENPLRYERLSLYRITLPESSAADAGRWKVSVDLGVVARTSAGHAFEPVTMVQAIDLGTTGLLGVSPWVADPVRPSMIVGSEGQ